MRQRCITFSFSLSSCERKARLAFGNVELIWVLAHVVPDLGDLIEFSGPLCHAVGRRLLLKPFQDRLVFDGNFHQLILALDTIQAGFLDSHGVVKIRSWVLHDIGHFLEQNPVFPLDLSIAS